MKTSASLGQRADSDFAADARFAKRDGLQRGGGEGGGGGGRDSSDISTSSSLRVESTKQGVAASAQACPSVISGILFVSGTDIHEEDRKSPCKV